MKTKVLYVAMKYDYGDKNRGISFEHRNFHDSMKTYAEKRNWDFIHYDFFTRTQEIGQDAMTEELYETAKREKPDMVFAVLCDPRVDPRYEVFNRISGLGAVTIHWFCDDHWRFDGYSCFVAPNFDLVCTTANSSLPKYQDMGLTDRVIKTQWACNHEIYVPFDITRDVDCSFVGMPHGDRIDVLNTLSSKGLGVEIYGYGWKYRPRLPFNQMVRMFSRSKVNLNLSNSAVSSAQQIKGRNFEVPGCRAFLLTGQAEDLDSYFENGKEIVVYNDLDDLVDKAKYYIAHDEEREAIASAAYERILAEHTWHHRYDVIFERAGAIKPRTYIAPMPVGNVDFLPGEGKSNFTSIVILNLNGDKHIRECVDSIRRNTNEPYELIVVDNGSKDDSLDYLRSLPFVKLIENKENVGVGLGRNQGLAVAEGEYIVFLDNDTIVTEGWLEKFLKYAKADASLGILGARSNYVSGPQVVPDAQYSTYDELQAFSNTWASQHKMEATLVQRLVGFCQFIRRSVIKKIGGTEPAFGLWGWDDDDLSLRAQLAGYKLAMANEVYIHHTGSQTSKTADLNYSNLLAEKWEIFRRKWGFHWTPGQPMSYAVDMIMQRKFDPQLHGIALPPREEIEKLIYKRSAESQFGNASENGTLRNTPLIADLLFTKRWDEAIDQLQKCLAENPDDARTLNQLGMALHGKGDDKGARNALRQAIESDAEYMDAYYGMAQLLLNGNRAIEAADYAIKAGQKDIPNDGAVQTIIDCRDALCRIKPVSKKHSKKSRGSVNQNAEVESRLQKLSAILDRTAKERKYGLSSVSRQKISLCMIVKNEEDLIDECLQSVENVADEIIVVDTGSTDRTAEIARTYGAEVIPFEWNNSFSEARNAAKEHASGDWILVLDADERLDDNARRLILKAVNDSEIDGYELAFLNYLSGGDSPNINISRCVRLFRNKQEYTYKGRIHEHIADSITDNDGRIRLLEAAVHHQGYRPEIIEARNKHERNLKLLMQDYTESPDDVYILYHLANQYYSVGDMEHALEYLQKAVPYILPIHQFRPLLFSNLADCLMASGNVEEALHSIEHATKLRANHPQLLHSKGNALRLVGEYESAVDAYEAAVELGKRGLWDGDPATYGYKAHYGAAAAYFAIGHYTKSIDHAQMALVAKPDHQESISILERAKKALADNGNKNLHEYDTSKTRSENGEKPKLSLCMIVKDEAEFLRGCIESARSIIDEIVIVDTGSSDNTVEIAKECGARVEFFPWNDNFADARNESLKYATGDWILILDADEILDADACPQIINAITNPVADAYEMFFHNPVSDEENSDYTEHRICRLFRNKPEYRFNSRIHENIETAVGKYHGTIGQITGVIHHKGYTQKLIEKRHKGERYTRILEQEVADHPGNVFYMHHLIAAYCAYGKMDKALTRLYEVVDIAELNNPFTPILWATLVNVLVELDRAEEALESCEKSKERGVYQHPQLYFCKGNALTKLERFEEAIECYRKAIEEGKGKTWNGDTQTAGYKANFGIANALHKLGRNQEAIPYLLKVIDFKPGHIAAQEIMTKAYAATNQMDKYEDQLGILQTLVPTDPGPSIRLAEIYEGRNNIEKARDIYVSIISHIEDNAVLEFKLGNFYETLGDVENAEKCYRRAIEIMPECKDAYNNLGLLLASQERIEEALECFVKSTEIDPEYANAYFNAGDVLYQAGLYEQSIDIYTNGISKAPEYAPAYFAIGNCYFQMGAYEAALMAYKETIRLDPTHTGAINNMSLVEDTITDRTASPAEETVI